MLPVFSFYVPFSCLCAQNNQPTIGAVSGLGEKRAINRAAAASQLLTADADQSLSLSLAVLSCFPSRYTRTHTHKELDRHVL